MQFLGDMLVPWKVSFATVLLVKKKGKPNTSHRFREVRKIIDSNVPAGDGICDRSLEGMLYSVVWQIPSKLDSHLASHSFLMDLWWIFVGCALPETNIGYHRFWKQTIPKGKFIFQPFMFRGELLVFREGISLIVMFVPKHGISMVSPYIVPSRMQDNTKLPCPPGKKGGKKDVWQVPSWWPVNLPPSNSNVPPPEIRPYFSGSLT